METKLRNINKGLINIEGLLPSRETANVANFLSTINDRLTEINERLIRVNWLLTNYKIILKENERRCGDLINNKYNICIENSIAEYAILENLCDKCLIYFDSLKKQNTIDTYEIISILSKN